MFKEFDIVFNHIENDQLIYLVLSFILLLTALGGFVLRKIFLSIVLLMISSLIIGLFFATIDPFIHEWDEVYHTIVASNLMETPLKPTFYGNEILPYNYQNWIGNYVWLHKPPLSLWQIALSFKLFGVNYFSARLPSIILHAFMVYPVYRMGKIIFSSKIGFLSSLAFTFLLYPLELVSGNHTADHIDLSFLFYITCSLWAYIEYNHSGKIYWLYLMGLFSGFAVLTKWLVGLLVFAVAFFVEISNSSKGLDFIRWLSLLKSFLLTCLIFLPWNIYAYIRFPKEYVHEMQFNSRHFSEVIEGHDGDCWFY